MLGIAAAGINKEHSDQFNADVWQIKPCSVSSKSAYDGHRNVQSHSLATNTRAQSSANLLQRCVSWWFSWSWFAFINQKLNDVPLFLSNPVAARCLSVVQYFN